jgi:GT2 family glycosyltransferase
VRIFIVDNGSTDGTSEMLRAITLCKRRYPLTVLEQPTPGKARALNQGLASAQSDLTIVLDDDVTVDELCLVKHFEAYQRTEFAAMQGKVLPGKDAEDQTADPKRLQEYNIPIIDYGDDIREIRGLTGTNMSFKREVFEKVGFFDPRLGPGASGFSEDTEFSMRIRKAGFKIGYTPGAVVYHELNPARYGRAYNRDVEFRKGVSRSIYRHDSILFKVIPDLVANCLRYGIYRILGLSQKAYKTEGRILKCWGYLSGKLQQASQGHSAL